MMTCDFDTCKAEALEAYQSGKILEAFDLFTSALHDRPTSFVVWAHRATAAVSLGMPSAALESAKRALELKPGHARSLVLAARALLAMNKSPAEVQHFYDEHCAPDVEMPASVHTMLTLAREIHRGVVDIKRLHELHVNGMITTTTGAGETRAKATVCTEDVEYPPCDYTHPAIVVQADPDGKKGRGLYVSHSHPEPIAMGTLLLCHRAMQMCTDIGVLGACRSAGERLAERVERDNVLRALMQDLFVGTTDVHELEGMATPERCFGALEYNGFEVQSMRNGRVHRDGSLRTVGLWASPVSMMNHSTTPNVAHVILHDVMLVRATADIMPGDEICTQYTGITDCFAVRQERLRKHFADVSDAFDVGGVDKDVVAPVEALAALHPTDAAVKLHELRQTLEANHADALTRDPASIALHLAMGTTLSDPNVGDYAGAYAAWRAALRQLSKRTAHSVDGCLYWANALSCFRRAVDREDNEERYAVDVEEQDTEATTFDEEGLQALRRVVKLEHMIVYGDEKMLGVLHPQLRL
eukprot:PhM_4_TR11199/c0_g1_i1/m.63975